MLFPAYRQSGERSIQGVHSDFHKLTSDRTDSTGQATAEIDHSRLLAVIVRTYDRNV